MSRKNNKTKTKTNIDPGATKVDESVSLTDYPFKFQPVDELSEEELEIISKLQFMDAETLSFLLKK